MLSLGDVVAGWLSRCGENFPFVLWLGVLLQLANTLSWLLFRADDGGWFVARMGNRPSVRQEGWTQPEMRTADVDTARQVPLP